MKVFSRNFNHPLKWKGPVLRAKQTFSDNPGHVMSELCNVLVQVWLATTKTELDFFYIKLLTRVPPWVSERLKTYDLTKLWNTKKISILGGDMA